MLPGQAQWFLERASFPASVVLLPYGGMAAIVLVAWLGLHPPYQSCATPDWSYQVSHMKGNHINELLQ